MNFHVLRWLSRIVYRTQRIVFGLVCFVSVMMCVFMPPVSLLRNFLLYVTFAEESAAEAYVVARNSNHSVLPYIDIRLN